MSDETYTTGRTHYPILEPWGWDERWAAAAAAYTNAGLVPARILGQEHHYYEVLAPPEGTRMRTTVAGAYEYRAAVPADFPTAGDWVLLSREGMRIEELLPRRTAMSRGSAGRETTEQVIVANVDLLLLVFGLDGGRNFTVGMLERSLVAAWNSGARPVVVLNKTDRVTQDQLEEARMTAEAGAPGVPIHSVSAVTGTGLRKLLSEATPGETIGMIGKSGVGKSALLNGFARLEGDTGEPLAREGAQRAGDLQGRHTTTGKQLYRLPGGIIVADVPGLRELQLWAEGEELTAAFPEIEALAGECRFSDCAHTGEPGCRVAEALAIGELPEERYARYLDYRKELAYLERRRDQRAKEEEQRKWRNIAKEQRRMKKR
ncbi:MAG: ribosome small subunit-dependent GTPase A [Alkalispirochaeta sp.]